jgi:hypothetical protein
MVDGTLFQAGTKEMNSTSERGLAAERRKKERIYVPFPATVEGVDKDGQKFKVDTVPR